MADARGIVRIVFACMSSCLLHIVGMMMWCVRVLLFRSARYNKSLFVDSLCTRGQILQTMVAKRKRADRVYGGHSYVPDTLAKASAFKPLPERFMAYLGRALRQIAPHRLEQEPQPEHREVFEVLIAGYSDAMKPAARAKFREMQSALGIHDGFLVFLDEARSDPCEENFLTLLKKDLGKRGHVLILRTALAELKKFSGTSSLTSCGNISQDGGRTFCWSRFQPRHLPDVRLEILRRTGFQHADALEAEWPEMELLAQEYVALHMTTENSFRQYRELRQIFNETPKSACSRLDAVEISRIFENAVFEGSGLAATRAFVIVKRELIACERQGVVKELLMLLPPAFTREAIFDWLARKSPWHGEVLNQMLAAVVGAHDRTSFS